MILFRGFSLSKHLNAMEIAAKITINLGLTKIKILKYALASLRKLSVQMNVDVARKGAKIEKSKIRTGLSLE